MNSVIQSEGASLNRLTSEIVRYRKLQKNANTAIDQISMCLPVLDSYVKLKELMKQRKRVITLFVERYLGTCRH